jgi:hypothetical protein
MNSAAIRLFGQLIPLIGRQNSAVWQRSGILRQTQWNQSLARSCLTCEGPESAFFAVFPLEQSNPECRQLRTSGTFPAKA